MQRLMQTLLILVMVVFPCPIEAAPSNPLFIGVSARLREKRNAAAVTTRLVLVAPNALAKQKFSLTLDRTYDAVVNSVDIVSGTTVYQGSLSSSGYFVLSYNHNGVGGSIWTATGYFEMTPHSPESAILEEIDVVKLPPLAEDTRRPSNVVPLHSPAPTPSQQAPGDTGDIVDLAMVYSEEAALVAGDIDGFIARELTKLNTALQQSFVDFRFRLVYSGPVANYTEPGSMEEMLRHLQNPTDGFADDVPVRRDQYGADVVHGLSAYTRGGCGVGFLLEKEELHNDRFAHLPYSVGSIHCSASFVLQHEIGHNLGLNHNHEVLTPTGREVTEFAFGYALNGVHRDIMAYPCSMPCVLLPYFSTPRIVINGYPLGVEGYADAAATLNITRFTAARWRVSIVPEYKTFAPFVVTG